MDSFTKSKEHVRLNSNPIFQTLDRLAKIPWLIEVSVIAIIFLVSATATYPIVFRLDSQIIGGKNDNLYFLWEVWWFKHSIVDLRTSPFIATDLYYPTGLELARDEITPANTILGLPITTIFGPVVAYNVLMLASFVLSGYATYRFIYEMNNDRIVALIGGIAFAIAPYRIAQYTTHLNLAATQWLALTLLFLERFFRTRRMLNGAITGFFFGLTAWAAWYYFVIGTVAISTFALVRSLPWRETWGNRQMWQGVGGFVLVASIFIIPFALPYLMLQPYGVYSRSFAEIEERSANIANYLLPSPYNPVFGPARLMETNLPLLNVDAILSTGWVMLTLGVLGTWRGWREPTVRALAIMALITFVLSLGPVLHLDEPRFVFPLPSWAVQFLETTGITRTLGNSVDSSLAYLIRKGTGFIPLPVILLIAISPFDIPMRQFSRFGMVTDLGILLLAGYGLMVVLENVPRNERMRRLTALIIGLVVLLETWSSFALSDSPWTRSPYNQLIDIQARPVDVWLSRLDAKYVIIEYPFGENTSSSAMMHQMFHRQSMVMGGMAPSFVPQIATSRTQILSGFPSAESIAAMRELQVNLILVSPPLFKTVDEWRNFAEGIRKLDGVNLIQVVGDVMVFEIAPPK